MSWKLEDLNLYTPVIKTSASFFTECLLELSVLSCAPLVVLELFFLAEITIICISTRNPRMHEHNARMI